MTSNTKILTAGVLVLAVVALVAIFEVMTPSQPAEQQQLAAAGNTAQTGTQQVQTPDSSVQPANPDAAAPASLPAPTGNVDDIVSALLQDSANEQAAVQADNSASTILTSDSSELANFGQSYNGNEF